MLRARVRRAGFTLVELLVAIVLFGVVGGTLLSLVARAQRAAGRLAARVEARRATRDAAAALTGALRGLAPRAGDLLLMDARAVELRATVAFSVICAIDDARSTLVIAPPVASGPALASWLAEPRIADTVLVWGEGPAAAGDTTADAAPRWTAAVLAADPAGGASCSPDAGLGDAAPSDGAVTLRVTPPLSADVSLGAPIRVVRRTRFALYRAGDGQWYLGASDCVPARAVPCATIQPVSGPYPSDGVALQYLDGAGATTTDPARVARIEIVVRAEGAPWPAAGDSLGAAAAPRG